MTFYLAQGFGLIVTVLALITPQCKKMSVVATLEFFMNLLGAFQYLLLSVTIGMETSLISAAYSLLLFLSGKFLTRGKTLAKIILTVLYLFSYFVVIFVGFKHIYDVLPCVVASLFVLSLVQKNVFRYNLCNVVKSFANITYQFCTAGYTLILAQLFVLISAIIAILRDLKQTKKNREMV